MTASLIHTAFDPLPYVLFSLASIATGLAIEVCATIKSKGVRHASCRSGGRRRKTSSGRPLGRRALEVARRDTSSREARFDAYRSAARTPEGQGPKP